MKDDVGTPVLSRQEASRSPEAAQASAPSRRTGARLRWAAVGLLVLLAAGGAWWWSARGGPSVRYVVMPATRGAIKRMVTTTGTVNPELTIIVGSYVSGVLQELYCDYNTRVKAGQVCAKIDPRPYQMVVNQNKAMLGVARAQLAKDEANRDYTRVNDQRSRVLLAQDSISKDAADLAKNAYDQAQAQVGLDQATIDQSQAALDAAEINLGYTDIVSPVNGTVVSRNVTQGQTMAASLQTPTLFLIATDLTKMQVDTNVSESDIGGIKEGDKATFTVDAFPGRVFHGQATQVRQSPQTVQNIVTYDAVISIGNQDLALKPGMTASTQIIIDQRDDVLRAPNQALRYAPGGLAGARGPEAGAPSGAGEQPRLWVLRDGQPVATPVTLGLQDDNFTEIVNGELGPGDQLIVGEERGAGGARAGVPTPRL
jgi:HlyD family secretion protein